MNALKLLKESPIFYSQKEFLAYGEFGEQKVADVMVEFSNLVNQEMQKECKRVKVQRNEYEQELLKVNRELIRLRSELKINGIVV